MPPKLENLGFFSADYLYFQYSVDKLKQVGILFEKRQIIKEI